MQIDLNQKELKNKIYKDLIKKIELIFINKLYLFINYLQKMNNQTKYYQDKLNYEMDSSDLFEAVRDGENIVVVDARKPFAYDAEHIPQAINIPHRDMNEASTKDLDKDALYVVYCDGIGCNASTKGALNMSKLGFKVKELIGGIGWWKFDGYDTEGTLMKTSGTNYECSC